MSLPRGGVNANFRYESAAKNHAMPDENVNPYHPHQTTTDEQNADRQQTVPLGFWATQKDARAKPCIVALAICAYFTISAVISKAPVVAVCGALSVPGVSVGSIRVIHRPRSDHVD